MKVKVNKVQIQIVEGDILDVSGSALVMVTDTNLNLDPDLLARGGAELALARQQIGWARVGSAVSTPAGKLPYQRLIYAIGPRWGEGSERGKLAYVVFHCLREAEEHGLRTLVFPAISVGAMGFPLESCARIMLGEIIDHSFEELRRLRKVTLCLPDTLARQIFELELERQVRMLQASGEGSVHAYQRG
jgi:O-acetyl-ADP-ribose deacetylase (regulator of RNase III)